MESWQRQPAAGGRVEKMISNPEKCRPDGGPKPALGGGREGGKEEAPRRKEEGPGREHRNWFGKIWGQSPRFLLFFIHRY